MNIYTPHQTQQTAPSASKTSLINCPACGQPVSPRAPACPGCGEPMEPTMIMRTSKWHKEMSVFLTLFIMGPGVLIISYGFMTKPEKPGAVVFGAIIFAIGFFCWLGIKANEWWEHD